MNFKKKVMLGVVLATLGWNSLYAQPIENKQTPSKKEQQTALVTNLLSEIKKERGVFKNAYEKPLEINGNVYFETQIKDLGGNPLTIKTTSIVENPTSKPEQLTCKKIEIKFKPYHSTNYFSIEDSGKLGVIESTDKVIYKGKEYSSQEFKEESTKDKANVWYQRLLQNLTKTAKLDRECYEVTKKLANKMCEPKRGFPQPNNSFSNLELPVGGMRHELGNGSHVALYPSHGCANLEFYGTYNGKKVYLENRVPWDQETATYIWRIGYEDHIRINSERKVPEVNLPRSQITKYNQLLTKMNKKVYIPLVKKIIKLLDK